MPPAHSAGGAAPCPPASGHEHPTPWCSRRDPFGRCVRMAAPFQPSHVLYAATGMPGLS